MIDTWQDGHVPDSVLSGYLDGDLTDRDVEAVEEHLGRCPECRTALDELRELVTSAGALADRPPERDLWPGIAEGMDAPAGPAKPAVVERPERSGAVRLSRSQLAAAALVLMLLSGGGVWLLGGGREPRTARPGAPAATTGAVRSAGVEETGAPAGYAAELEALESTIREHRKGLDPNTVRIVEKNLALIDRAIRESRAALEIDPGNDFLESHLERAYRTKIEYLREATRLVEWSS